MADGTGEQDSAAVAQVDSVQTEVESFVGEDGTFREGWIDALVPEDLRHLGDYKPIVNVAQLAKEFGHAKTLIGRQGKGIMPLSKEAGQTEREAYYAALGRPKAPEDYKVVLPEDTPDDVKEQYQPVALKDAFQVMHGLGLTPEQVQGVVAFDANRTREAIAKQQASDEAAYDEGMKLLRKEWGDAFDQKMRQANALIEKGVPEDKREGLLARWGNDPDLVRALSKMGELLLEDTVADAGGAGARAMTPDELENKAKELMQTPGYIEGRLPEATMTRLQKEIHSLYEQARKAREGA